LVHVLSTPHDPLGFHGVITTVTVNQSRFLFILPYAGVVPFAVGTLLVLMRVHSLPFIGSTQYAVLSYGLLIISFMAGVHWGQYLSGVRGKVNLLVSSNVVALLAWFGFLLLPTFWFLVLLVVLFAVLYFIDTQLHASSEYLNTRRNVTAVVCLSLLVMAFT
jgi:Protein of unknown function (DUF3429)